MVSHKMVSRQSGLSSGWSLIRWSLIRVVTHRVVSHQSVSSGWSLIRVVTHQVVSRQGGHSSGGLSSGWSLVRVVFHQMVFHQGGLVRVVSHQGGLSSRWSLIRGCNVQAEDSPSLVITQQPLELSCFSVTDPWSSTNPPFRPLLLALKGDLDRGVLHGQGIVYRETHKERFSIGAVLK